MNNTASPTESQVTKIRKTPNMLQKAKETGAVFNGKKEPTQQLDCATSLTGGGSALRKAESISPGQQARQAIAQAIKTKQQQQQVN